MSCEHNSPPSPPAHMDFNVELGGTPCDSSIPQDSFVENNVTNSNSLELAQSEKPKADSAQEGSLDLTNYVHEHYVPNSTPFVLVEDLIKSNSPVAKRTRAKLLQKQTEQSVSNCTNYNNDPAHPIDENNAVTVPALEVDNLVGNDDNARFMCDMYDILTSTQTCPPPPTPPNVEIPTGIFALTTNASPDKTDDDTLLLTPTAEETIELEDPVADLLAKFPEANVNSNFPANIPAPFNNVLNEPSTFCEDCNIEMNEERPFADHRARVHGDFSHHSPVFMPSYLCHSCSQSFSTLQAKRDHNCPALPRSSHICNMCHRDCRTAKGLRAHKASVHHIYPTRRTRQVPDSQRSIPEVRTGTNGPVSNTQANQVVDTLEVSNVPSSDDQVVFTVLDQTGLLDRSLSTRQIQDRLRIAPIPITNTDQAQRTCGAHDQQIDQQVDDPPPPGVDDLTSTGQSCPSRTIRVGNSLHLPFPLSDPLTCTEEGCHTSYTTRSWNSNKGNLIRHLCTKHHIRIQSHTFWCSVCKTRIQQPSQHGCLSDGVMIRTTNNLTHNCPHCHLTFGTKIGLRNHVQVHKRREAEQNSSTSSFTVPTIQGRRRRRNRGNAIEPPTGEEEDANIDNPTLRLAPDEDSGIATGSSQEQTEEAEESISEKYLRLFRVILDGETTPEAFLFFDELVRQFCIEAKLCIQENSTQHRSNSNTTSTNSGEPTTRVADDAQAIQKLYRQNKKRAMREILNSLADRCSIDCNYIYNYFSTAWGPALSDPTYYNLAEDGRVEVLDRPFTLKEVATKLRKADNTAPGPDRITYHHWRQIDPSGKTITTIFNLCLNFKKIPRDWKKSVTILLPKTGDTSDPRNWRPIALSNTLYKLFTKCLASRLSDWCTRYDALCPGQKGFMPHDGVLEHNFALQCADLFTREKRKEICVAWVDVSNAFGALPHSAILNALQSARVGDSLVELVKDIYTESTTQILTNGTKTEDINILSGVKQGCPLSGILFNISIDPTLRRLQGDSLDRKVLAFADDIAIIASSPSELQSQLNLLHNDFTRISLSLNPRKSVSYHLSGATPVGAKDTTFFINGEPIRALKEFENTKFLGKPVGYNPIPDYTNLDAITALGKAIAKSMLAPWQKLDALKCFFFPSMQFSMRTGIHKKTDWAKIDVAIRKAIKEILNLPQEASNKYLYGNRKLGCIGIPIAAEESDLNLIDSAFKLLTSRDEITARTAMEDLLATVKFRSQRPATDEDLSKFMSGERIGDFQAQANRHSNIWTLARSASRRLNVEWDFDRNIPSIMFQDLTLQPNSRRKILWTIRNRLRSDRTMKLINENHHQGKVLDCVSMSPASSHFFTDGAYTRFAEWRFVHPARLGLVPLNGYQTWRPASEQKCRRCHYADKETLPHVVNHCKFTSRAWLPRHNSVEKRIIKAITPKAQILFRNQPIPGFTTHNKPDIVVAHQNNIYIVDVCCPFENKREAFDIARDRKVENYTPLIDYFKTPSNNVQIVPFVVGALGAWDPRNDWFMKKFVTNSYLNLFRKLCVSDVLRWSRDIYIEHLSGIRQYDMNAINNNTQRPVEVETEDPEFYNYNNPNRGQQHELTTNQSTSGQEISTNTDDRQRPVEVEEEQDLNQDQARRQL
ncbi:unnamed protein product [Larinioides sclopetarius]|uniref:Retrovirus-related Pol polyprotein from type-1 retrotransposable element R2 n=1 Tax=Larinioides sclopetarius TaxID=280406 RepID=A0AAV2BSX3_9ARAC